MIKNLVKHVERQPVSTLLVAVAGVAATVAIVRATQQNPDYVTATKRRARHVGERGGRLADSGARRVADNGADVVEHASRLADRTGEHGSSLAALGARLFGRAEEKGAELADSGSRLIERAGKSGSELAHRGSRLASHAGSRGVELAERGSSLLGKEFNAIRHRASRPSRRSGKHGLQRMTSSMGIEEKTLAVFLATVLAKSATGFLRWQAEQKARHQVDVLASDEGMDFETELEMQTVAELRKQASEMDIAGRSSMNKVELVEALKG